MIALRTRDATETLRHRRTCILFEERSVNGLTVALRRYDPDGFETSVIRFHAEGLGEPQFQRRRLNVVREGALTAAWTPDRPSHKPSDDSSPSQPIKPSRSLLRHQRSRVDRVAGSCAVNIGWLRGEDQEAPRW